MQKIVIKIKSIELRDSKDPEWFVHQKLIEAGVPLKRLTGDLSTGKILYEENLQEPCHVYIWQADN